MLNQATILSNSPQFHPATGGTAPSVSAVRLVKAPAGLNAAPARPVPLKRRSCKTCSGNYCIGRCRF